MQDSRLTTITATELKQKSGEILRRAVQNSEQFVVERGGYKTVVLLSIQNYEALLINMNEPKDCK